MDPYKNAAGDDPSRGDGPAWMFRGDCFFASSMPRAMRILATRIGRCRQHRSLGVAALEAAAGSVIDRDPDCSPSASRLVDRLTLARELALLESRP